MNAANAAPDPNLPTRTKNKNYDSVLKLVLGLLASVVPLADSDPVEDRRRLVEDLENAAGYVDDQTPGLVKTRAFFQNVRGKVAGKHRRLYDDINGRPTIRAVLQQAHADYAAYLQDLNVDHTGLNAGNDIPPPDYGPWWTRFKPLRTCCSLCRSPAS